MLIVERHVRSVKTLFFQCARNRIKFRVYIIKYAINAFAYYAHTLISVDVIN